MRLPAHAAWIDKSGQSLPNTEARQAAGRFGAQLVLVADEEELFRRWPIASDTVDVKTIDRIETNGAINAFIVFSGCAPDKSGKCNVTMQYRVLQPDGKVYANTPAMEVWQGKPAPLGKSLELSVQYMKIVIEPKDQSGKYVIYSQVKDENIGTVLKLKAPFIANRAR